MNFFPKIPEIHLPRFSFQFSFNVVVAIHEKLEKFQNISIEDLSENLHPINKKSLNGPIKLCFGTICKNSLNAL
jgi:hypothetical protein